MSHAAVGIVADDLTGAADSAVQFARAGWTARLALGGGHPGAGGPDAVVAIVTDTRALGPDDAHAITAAAVRGLASEGTGRVFVKIDSTMRGSVASQVSGALTAWREVHPEAIAVVSPAYPAMGRTVQDGRVLVDGAPVEATAIGRDPVTPVRTSELTRLVPGSTGVSISGDDVATAARRIAAAAASSRLGVVTLDASTDDELRLTARAVALLGVRAVPVGSAGLAEAVSRAWDGALEESAPADVDGPRHVVVVISSLHDASRQQHDHLDRVLAGATDTAPGRPVFRTVAPTLAEVVAGDLEPALGRGSASDAAPDADRVTVVVSPARSDGDAARDTAGGAGGATEAERVADALATLTDRVVGDSDDVALVLVGGEGARAVLHRVGAEAVLVRGALREGVPWGTLEGGRLHGRPVVTKAGGFGPVSTISDVVTDLFSSHTRTARQGAPA